MNRATSRGIRLSSVACAVVVLAVSAWFNQASANEVSPELHLNYFLAPWSFKNHLEQGLIVLSGM